MTEIEDEAHPGVSEAFFKVEVVSKTEHGGVRNNRLIVVLDSVGEAELLVPQKAMAVSMH